MVYNKEEFFTYLKDNDFTVFVCFDGLLNEKTITERFPMEQHLPKNESSSKEIVLTKIENIINRKPGKYTFLLAKKYSTRNGMMRIQVDTYPQLHVLDKNYQQLDQEPTNEQNLFQNLSTEEINKRIDEQVNARLIAREKQLEIEEKDRRLKELETNGGKLAYFMAELLKQLNLVPTQMPKTSTVMNGTDFQPGTEQQAAQIEYTPAQQKNLEKAFGILLKKLGYKTVLNLAKKIDQGQADHLLPMIENFANN